MWPPPTWLPSSSRLLSGTEEDCASLVSMAASAMAPLSPMRLCDRSSVRREDIIPAQEMGVRVSLTKPRPGSPRCCCRAFFAVQSCRLFTRLPDLHVAALCGLARLTYCLHRLGQAHSTHVTQPAPRQPQRGELLAAEQGPVHQAGNEVITLRC